jgi:hypothetical protein
VHRHGSVLNCLIVCIADLKTAYRHKILAQFADLEARVQSKRARADALEDAIRPLVDELVPLTEPEPRQFADPRHSEHPSLIERLQQVPERLREYIRTISLASTTHVLAIFKSLYPAMNLNRLMGGYAHGTTTTRISELHMEVKDVATKLADDVMSSDNDNDDDDDGAPATATLTM